MHPTSRAHETEKEKKKKREGHEMGLEKSLGHGKKESGPIAEKKKKREGVDRAEKEREGKRLVLQFLKQGKQYSNQFQIRRIQTQFEQQTLK
jgi:hypothetical protein